MIRAVIKRRSVSISARINRQIIDTSHLLVDVNRKSIVSRVSTRLSPRGRNSKESAQTQQYRATARSTMTHYCSGRDMDQIHFGFYVDSCIKILAHRLRPKTYAVTMIDFRPELTLLQFHSYRTILWGLLLLFHLWSSFIESTNFHVYHAQLDSKILHETKACFEWELQRQTLCWWISSIKWLDRR